MKTPRTNAFTINRLHQIRTSEFEALLGRLARSEPWDLEGSFFPFSFRLSQKASVVSVFVCPQRIVDLCDLIEQHTLDCLVVFDVGHTELSELTGKIKSLEDLATKSKIPFSAVNSETIVLRKQYLLPLLSTFRHFDLYLFDIGNDWNEVQVTGQVLACREHDQQSHEAVLSTLSASQFFLYGHDDCYLTVETYEASAAKQIFARTLQIYAGTILDQENMPAFNVPEIPRDMLDAFWRDNLETSILRQATEIRDDRLEIGVSRQPFAFGEIIEYPLEFWIVYNVQNQTWLVETKPRPAERSSNGETQG